MDEIMLSVAKAYPNDSGRGIARLDPHTMMILQLTPGDIIEIEGKKRTSAKVWRADRIDWDQDIIRIDGFIRQNAGAGIGDNVRVKKTEVKIANKVVLAPPEGTSIQFGGEAEEMVKRQIMKRSVVKGDIIPVMSTMAHPFLGRVVTGQTIPLVAIEAEPEGIILVTESTDIKLREKPVVLEVTGTGITYEDIGGLSDEIQRLREMIELPMKHPEIFEKLGIESPKGVLMYGPPGTGKTLIARAVANESGANFFSIAGPEIMSKYYGESEQRLRELFEQANKEAPSIIFIDELDSIAPKREEVTGEVERRVVAQLLTMMDGLEERGQVVVIGATNRIDAIDPALRRPGRFDREIEIGVPDRNERIEILQIHTRGMPLAEDVKLEDIGDRTHGFVGADISALVREAAMKALRRYLPQIKLDEAVPREVLNSMQVTAGDFDAAHKDVEPSAMREVLVEVPRVTWDDVGGLDEAKQEIVEAVEWPLKSPERFEKMGIQPPKGILLYGPPGTGKTLLAKAVANESSANFISVRGPQLLSKWVGESEKAVREVFKKSRQVAPCVLFLDELDAIAPIRGMDTGSKASERVVNQLLTELDGIETLKNVVVIAATNRPEIIDPALIRSGRFDRLVFVGPSGRAGRVEIFKIHLKNVPLADDVSVEELADLTDNYVGADIEALCREAVMLALRENFDTDKVEMRHFRDSLKKVRPALVEGMVEYYEKLKVQFQGGAKPEQKSYIGYR
ncbi:CDC48 family AAA ATPase [Candidatus Methanoperedens nitratireducens]|uniref:Protein CdcH n=1 Tax=Candidatus Methanoperedens nitratireducens TaxID=1392998 RepID=A0A284VT59_9EURY|nr:CDC48 family AAA ATPase [Candidatus Methanoperedens nitroreducens]SNQ62475.1 Protein CdcH [Candidatus Methanoperedens nitroreducens]